MDANVYILEGQEKGGSHYLPTAFRCDVLLECHHIGKRLDWDKIHSWKKRAEGSKRLPQAGRKEMQNHSVSLSTPLEHLREPLVTHPQ